MASGQLNQQNFGSVGHVPNVDDDDIFYPANRRHAKNVIPTNQNRQERVRMHQQTAFQFNLGDEDITDFDKAVATVATTLPPLALELKFNITNNIIQLLNFKGLFGGLSGDDLNLHLVNFINNCKSFDNYRVGKNAICLRFFTLSLFGEVTLWMNELGLDSIKKLEAT